MIRGVAKALAVLAGAGAAAFAWGSLIERNAYVLRRVDVPVLPAGSDPITVLHLSDLHMAPWQRRKQEWVRSLADLRPDFVVDTGDNLGHARGIEGIRQALEVFRGTPGAFVWGSNDYFGPHFKNPFLYFSRTVRKPPKLVPLDREGLERYLEGLGWADLDNRAARVEVGGLRIELFGTDDAHKHFDRLDVVSAAVDDLRERESEGPDLVLAVTHAPYQRVLDSFVTHGADLILAGHTHGGQVCVPGFGALVTNCDIPREQVKGLSLWAHARRVAWLHVSAGLGTSIYAPVRFACRPEATLLTLTASE
ncbi:metallophosphoesterase [Herbiconiux sp. L3-i23]|nr:metallophosphoesterase [Herbiconiux sp. L3-i23]BDI21521.1 metallophosphoesterase [Herbiconiux sp. L3-i23]